MNIDNIIDNERPESRELDYKHPEANIGDLVKELVAVANSGGGTVIVGIEEDGGKIVDIHDVPNPSKMEEGIQQHIREKVDPVLGVDHSVKQYTGDTNDYQNCEILILTAEPGQTLYSYEESRSKIIFPYRLGSTTDYLTGSKIYRFYQNGIWPGRPEGTPHEENQVSSGSNKTVNSEDERPSNPWGEVAETLAEVMSEEENGDEDQNDTSPDDQLLSDFEPKSSETPYHFTPAGGLETITFHHASYYPEAYGIEGHSIFIEKEDLIKTFAALKEYFNAELETGHFTITQRNSAWFGRGVGDFLAALNVDDRYTSVPDSFTINKHHSEGTVFITDSNIGTVVVRSRRGINNSQQYLDEFAVSFCTDGIPIDTRSLDQFLSTLDYGIHHAQPFEMERAQLNFGGNGIGVEPIKLLQSQHSDNYAGWAICPNPFYEQPELLMENIDSEKDDFESLTKYERVPCRIKDHHPINERHNYELLRATITPLTPVQGSVPHANAMIWINW